MTTESSEDKNKSINKGWFIAGIITIGVALALPFIIMVVSGTAFNVERIGTLGAVGDFFGGSTIGLLSIASIFFIIHTISIQSKELSLQREELQLTRKELEDTRKVHEASNNLTNIQRFETTFFNMLSLYNEIIKNISVRTNENSGRDALRYYWNYFKGPYSIQRTVTEEQRLEICYTKLGEVFDESFRHYCKNIYSILNFVDSSELNDADKKKYIDILSAQMSQAEFKLIFYNVRKYNNENIKQVMLNTEFFKKNLVKEDLLEIDHGSWLIQ